MAPWIDARAALPTIPMHRSRARVLACVIAPDCLPSCCRTCSRRLVVEVTDKNKAVSRVKETQNLYILNMFSCRESCVIPQALSTTPWNDH